MGIILNIILQNIHISGYQLCLLYSQSHDITTKLTEKRFENCYRSAYTEFEFLVIILILSWREISLKSYHINDHQQNRTADDYDSNLPTVIPNNNNIYTIEASLNYFVIQAPNVLI